MYSSSLYPLRFLGATPKRFRPYRQQNDQVEQALALHKKQNELLETIADAMKHVLLELKDLKMLFIQQFAQH